MQTKKIGFIGLGNMATAMIGGMLQKGVVAPENLIGSARTAATCRRVAEQYGITTYPSNVEVAAQADILFLAVKPQFFREVIGEIRDTVPSGSLIVSIAAGKTLEEIAGLFGGERKILRCMPNTPALVLEGCTGVCASEMVSGEETEEVLTLLRSFGVAESVPEFPRLCVSVSGGPGRRGGGGGYAPPSGIYLCRPGRAGQREADAGDGEAPGRIEGHGLFPGGNHDPGCESTGRKGAAGGGDGRHGGLHREIQKYVTLWSLFAYARRISMQRNRVTCAGREGEPYSLRAGRIFLCRFPSGSVPHRKALPDRKYKNPGFPRACTMVYSSMAPAQDGAFRGSPRACMMVYGVDRYGRMRQEPSSNVCMYHGIHEACCDRKKFSDSNGGRGI